MAELRRKVYAYRHMLMVAERMAKQATGDKERDSSIAAIVFCAFSLEGYLNHAGEEMIQKWNELFESLKPKAKLVMLTDRYGMNIECGSPPFQAFGTIFEVRNQLAHPKTKKHDYKEKKGKVWLEIGTARWPAETWESLCEARYAESFVENTKEMIKLLDNRPRFFRPKSRLFLDILFVYSGDSPTSTTNRFPCGVCALSAVS